MAGLIPLSLNREDSSRYSLLFADGDQPLSSRCDCTIMRPKPLKFVKRSSQPPALPPLRLLPYSSSEWKRTLSDIKRDFLNRQYQPCYTRCQEIIDGVKNWVRYHWCFMAPSQYTHSCSRLIITYIGQRRSCTHHLPPLLRC